MNNELQERLKKYQKYIDDNNIFVPEKFVYGELVVGVILIAISYYWIDWLKYLGGVLIFLAGIDSFRRQGHRKGFLNGYDEGFIDGYDKCEGENKS